MLLGMMVVGSSALSFNDTDDISNVTAATVLQELGVMIGTNKGDFQPEKPVTRAQMAIIVCRMLYGEKLNVEQFAGVSQYSDVPANEYYTGSINLATSLGIINGYGNGKFGPDDTVTTAQAALMLCRALGYFQAGEDKGDWSSVSLTAIAQATKIKMFGDLKLNTNELLARDNVCEMVFNAMTKAVPVMYNDRWGVYYTDSDNVLNGTKFNYVNTLGYQNFDLVYNEDKTDDFERPVTEWGIGTVRNGYTDDKGNITENGSTIKTSFIKEMKDADQTYTKKVKVADIYKDLGLTETIDDSNVTVYVDGEFISTSGDDGVNDIKRSDTTTKYGGNGVLTQVFFFPGARDNEDDRIVITEVNTYTGKTVRNVAASGSRDAYVLISTSTSAPNYVSGQLEYDTDETYEASTRVIYTYSQKEDKIVELAIPEVVSGTVTKTENDKTVLDGGDHKALTIDSKRYEKAEKGDGESFGSVSVKNDYTVYLDFYGYMIYVEETDLGNSNYALLVNAAAPGAFLGNKARLLFTDGTVEDVTTSKNYGSGSSDEIPEYSIVTFREDSDGVYTLKEVAKDKSFANAIKTNGKINGSGGDLAIADYVGDTIASGNTFSLENGKASIRVDADAKDRRNTAQAPEDTIFHANSATAFVVADAGKGGNDSDFTAYTGIKNAPTLAATADGKTNGVAAYWYCKNSDMISVMFIFPGSGIVVEDGNSEYIYVSRKSADNITSDENDEVYIEYNAIVNGEIQTSKVKVSGDVKINNKGTAYNALSMSAVGTPAAFADEKATANKDSGLAGVYKSFSSNKRDVVTNLRAYPNYNDADGKTGIIIGAGYEMDKSSSVNAQYTLIMNDSVSGDEVTYTTDENCKYFYVDKDNKIHYSSYDSLTTDPDDIVYAVIKDGMVQILIVEAVGTPAATYSISFTDATNKVTYGDGSAVTTPISGIARGDSRTFTVKPKEGVSDVVLTVNGTPLTPIATNTYRIDDIKNNVTVSVSATGDAVENVKLDLAFAAGITAQVEIGKDSYIQAKTGIEIEKDKTLTVNITWADGTPENAKKVWYNNALQSAFSTSGNAQKFLIPAGTNATNTLFVGQATKTLTLPDKWTAAWTGVDAKHTASGTFTASGSTLTTNVPVGVDVTVTPDNDGKSANWYLYNEYATADADKMVKNGNLTYTVDKNATFTADKYVKLTVGSSVTNSATTTALQAGSYGSATFNAAYTSGGLPIGSDVFVKSDDEVVVTISTTATAGTTTGAGAVKVAQITLATGVTTAEVSSAIGAGSTFDVDNSKDVTFTFTVAPTAGGGDLELNITLADA